MPCTRFGNASFRREKSALQVVAEFDYFFFPERDDVTAGIFATFEPWGIMGINFMSLSA
jgi:hypothetical protein